MVKTNIGLARRVKTSVEKSIEGTPPRGFELYREGRWTKDLGHGLSAPQLDRNEHCMRCSLG